MARKHKTNKRPGKGYRIALGLLAGLLLAVGAAIGLSALRANTVHVRYATVAINDLPPAFEGTTLLYASDVDLCGLNTPKKAAALFSDLQALRPDILLLGGDYTSESVLDALNRGEDADARMAERLRARSDFFHYISGFSAPLGKLAVAAPEDGDRAALSSLLLEVGIQPLFDERIDVKKNGETLSFVGICEEGAALSSIAGGIGRSDCAIAVAWSPNGYPAAITSEAADGGVWADLFLCGHTHGGQIRLFGRSVLPLERLEAQAEPGWRVENGLPILVTAGTGCEGANLRVGTRAEVWLITLTRA